MRCWICPFAMAVRFATGKPDTSPSTIYGVECTVNITQFECAFAFVDKKQAQQQALSTVWIEQKIGQGDHCSGCPKLHTKPCEIISACAIDSAGKRWLMPSRKLKELNAGGPTQGA